MTGGEEHAGFFYNRLKKKKRLLIPWAERHGIEAFRLYDRDLPEVPLTVDIYGDYVTVHDFRKDRSDRDWLEAMTQAVLKVTGCPEDRCFLHERHSRAGGQYRKRELPPREVIVGEQGARFLVKLGRYADTGLFSDHRLTRQWVRDRAAGKDVLNLYAYTGAFSVYAALGGAASTLSVDLSRPYCLWARRNLELNGITAKEHRVENSDVFAFLDRAPGGAWDMIIIDPPTFSTSKKMDYVFDIKKDHSRLIRKALPLLKREGTILFSTNARKFQMDPALSGEAEIREITEETIPADFQQHRPHQCWVVKRTERSVGQETREG